MTFFSYFLVYLFIKRQLCWKVKLCLLLLTKINSCASSCVWRKQFVKKKNAIKLLVFSLHNKSNFSLSLLWISPSENIFVLVLWILLWRNKNPSLFTILEASQDLHKFVVVIPEANHLLHVLMLYSLLCDSTLYVIVGKTRVNDKICMIQLSFIISYSKWQGYT